MTAAPLTTAEARLLLGLTADAGQAEFIGAFRAAAKLAHPDRPGGDAERFRQILAAYRLLQATPNLPAPISPAPAYVEIDPLTALRGGDAEAWVGGARVRLRIPAGARHGERIGVAGTPVAVRIAAGESMQVRGSDLWVTAEVAANVLDGGGRVRVATPIGQKVVWVSGKIAERRLIRIEGQGLPARGDHAQGSLFIRLVPDTGAPESPARTQLRRFAAAWAA